MGATRTEAVKAMLAGLLLASLMLPVVSHARRSHSFVGRWRLVDPEGRTAAWLVVDDSSAKRGHSPETCSPEVVDGEMRLAWPDGFKDVLKTGGDGPELLALPKEDVDWQSLPRFKLRMERQ